MSPDWRAHGHDTTYNVLDELAIASKYIDNMDERIRTIMCGGSLCGYEIGLISQRLPLADVFVVEAVPETYNAFLSHERPCCPAKAHTFCEVLSDVVQETDLYISHNNPCHSILPQVYGWESIRKVTTTTLEILCKKHGISPDLLMVDVEGATARVLRGAGDSILDSVQIIMAETEITREVLFRGGDSDADVDDLLVSHGMRRVSKVIDPALRQSNSVWIR